MKTKIRTSSAICLVFLSFGMLSGCSKKVPQSAGGDIRFVASLDGALTRTSYSGEGYDSSDHETTESTGLMVKERIDWVEGDEFTVVSDNATDNNNPSRHWSNYTVQSLTTENVVNSRATVYPSSGKGLQWGTASSYCFHARYPADGNKISGNSSGATMQATIPSQWNGAGTPVMTFTTETVTEGGETMRRIVGTPDMDYAFMFASQRTTNTTDAVRMEFCPIFSAFQFTVGKGDNASVHLTSFKLETLSTGASIAGDFTLTYTVGGVVQDASKIAIASGGSSSVTVNLTDSSTGAPMTLDSTTPTLVFTVFAFPKEMTSMRITFTGSEFGERTLLLNYSTPTTVPGATAGAPITFGAFMKHRIYGLRFPNLLTEHGEEIEWDQEVFGEDIQWL